MWTRVCIEDIQVFDVVFHAQYTYVIRGISRNSEGQTFLFTRVDDGKQGKLFFSPFSFGYLMERFSREEKK